MISKADKLTTPIINSITAPRPVDLFTQAQVIPPINTPRSISVVGGGFCGTVAVVQLLRELTDLASTSGRAPSLVINWFDSHGDFARGLPYRRQLRDDDNHKLILNQPADLMSPFADDPKAYSRWLALHHPEYNGLSFTPRSVFGDFLEQVLIDSQAAAQAAGCKFSLKLHTAHVRGVRTEDTRVYFGNNDEQISSDAIIIATGHRQRDQFAHLNGTPRYIATPFNVTSFRDLGLEQLREVVIIGGGASAVDAIRTLELLGFSGRYLYVNRRILPPWPFDPKIYLGDKAGRFQSLHLKPEAIPDNITYRQLCRLLRAEVLSARRNGFGDGHVYYGIDIAGIEARLRSIADRQAALEFGSLISFLRGNITAPENISLLRELNQQKRLRYIKGRADPGDTKYHLADKKYAVVVRHPSGKKIKVGGDALVNCALFIKSDSGDMHSIGNTGVANKQNIFFVGPARVNNGVIPRTWGVESFREEIQQTARIIL